MTVPLRVEVADPDLLLGLVEARGLSCGPSPPALASELDAAVARRAGTEPQPDATKSAIRDLLRKGGYKPTGRGKPASEYLAQAAARGEFPRINAPVDALNLVSLESGLPISLIDVDRALQGATGLVVRLGAAGERFVFNAAGQEIDVEGLICVARDGGAAIGNPVKDSMATKTTPETRNVLAVIFASRRVVDEAALRAVCARLAAMFAKHAGAAATDVRVVAAG